MSVASAVLVLQDPKLNVHRLDERSVFIEKRKHVPTCRTLKLNLLDFLHFVKTVGSSYADQLGRVAFVGFEVQVQSDFLYAHFLEELNID